MRSVLLALFVFLAFSYNLRFLENPEEMSLVDRILGRLSTYGLRENLYVMGLTVLFWQWFRFFGDRALFASKPLTIIACLFGLVNEGGLQLFYRNMLPWFTLRALALFLFQAAAWTLLFLFCGRVILLLLEKLGERIGAEQRPIGGFLAVLDRHLLLSAFLIILLGWLPWIISYYPASIEWDVYDPILQWLGQRTPSNHHPWFFTMIVGSAWKLGNDLGDRNMGIFLYILIRDLCLAAIYARCVLLEKKGGLPRPVYFTVILFFAFTPVWGAYAKHAFKDTVAAGLFCWYIHLLVEVIQRIRSGKNSPSICLEYSAAALLGCLFRNNTVYVTVPVTVLLAVLCVTKKTGWKTVLLLLTGILIFYAYETYIFEVLHVEKSPEREMLSIPFQQTARTVKYQGDRITEEEKRVIGACLIYDSLAGDYDPIISDPVKDGEHGSDAERDAYLKTWASMFFRFPDIYLEAFLAHSSGYYCFTPEYTEVQRYGPGSHSNVGMSIFSWVEDPRFPDWLNCSYREGMEWLRQALEQWAEIWHQIPILNLTDMKPLYTWVILLMSGLLIRRREYDKLLPTGACVLMILSCVASPVNDCFRYYAPVAAAFPGLLLLTQRGYGKE